MSYHSRVRLTWWLGFRVSTDLPRKFFTFQPQVSKTIRGTPPCHLSSHLFVVLSFVGGGTKPSCTANAPPTLNSIAAVLNSEDSREEHLLPWV